MQAAELPKRRGPLPVLQADAAASATMRAITPPRRRRPPPALGPPGEAAAVPAAAAAIVRVRGLPSLLAASSAPYWLMDCNLVGCASLSGGWATNRRCAQSRNGECDPLHFSDSDLRPRRNCHPPRPRGRCHLVGQPRRPRLRPWPRPGRPRRGGGARRHRSRVRQGACGQLSLSDKSFGGHFSLFRRRASSRAEQSEAQ